MGRLNDYGCRGSGKATITMQEEMPCHAPGLEVAAVVQASSEYSDKRYRIHAGINIIEVEGGKRLVKTLGAEKQAIKHPKDKHDPVLTLKGVFAELMTELELTKWQRTLLWAAVMRSFDFNQFGNVYMNQVIAQDGLFEVFDSLKYKV